MYKYQFINLVNIPSQGKKLIIENLGKEKKEDMGNIVFSAQALYVL